MKVLNQACFLFFAFIILSGNACETPESQNYERIERLQDSSIVRRVQIVNGKKEGKMTDFYPGGELMAERWFKDGIQEGKALIYYPGGQLKEVQYYRQGMQYSGDTIWYENGQVQFTVTLEKDKKNGYLHKWSPEGKLIFECRYANDSLVEVKGERIRSEKSSNGDSSETR